MSFSQYAGVAVVPTLSRIVLALAFATAGFNKLTNDSDYSAADATILRDLGVEVTEKADTSAALHSHIKLVSYQSEQSGEETTGEENQEQPGGDEAGETGDPPAEPTAGEAQPTSEPSTPALPEGTYTAKQLHGVTLICHKAGWPNAVIMAWLLALTEFVGGALLFLGLFSRIWGLGLAIAMAGAFYLVSMNLMGVHKTNPLDLPNDLNMYKTVYLQLGLFVLALGVFVTGPGPLSLDRLFFGKGEKPTGATDSAEVADSKDGRPV